ncbi:MAG: nuclear transport factor 2 family protein [Pseudomonadales bacterium]
MSGSRITRWRARIAAVTAIASLLSACAGTGGGEIGASPEQQVMAAERAFAATMAARDIDAFATYIDDEAVFFSGSETLRGRTAVVGGWAPLFDGPAAPFSWQPDQVEVLASGTLALSTGPVMNPDGKPVARFNSIWRRDAAGDWKIVFDKGSPLEPARGD